VKSPSLPDWPIVEGAEGVVLIVGRGMEAEVVARTKSAIITVGDETTIMTIPRVKPSLNLERTDDRISFTFKCYRLLLANSTYLQLETLLAHISLRFHLELSKYRLIHIGTGN
jgi:energy-converting hydrogenase Eha subunit E